ncbi:iron-containing redox enzyme family protein [Marmoricola sp. RAF53]|uniref:iron-containing redox enzyme family protein n=1 Tax=Marmoricola sp. RAF53 TaxID=3233059 RepID=UPI003F9CEAF9
MKLPQPRGELSEDVFAALLRDRAVPSFHAPTDEEDRQIVLWAAYELHYRGFDDVDPAREWDPCLLDIRAELEGPFEAELRDLTQGLVDDASGCPTLVAGLERITEPEGPSVARFLQRHATLEQFLEFLALRSVYHLKETDAHTWLLPRISGPAKVALAELCYDEFGAGRPEASHQRLYADALQEVGLAAEYGYYVDQAPADVLAVNNAMSLFGLHRRLRGACAGHLAAFEMTSSLPCRRIVGGAERLGLGPAVVRYFDEHVEADAVHEQIAARSLCGSLARTEPALQRDILFGAAACVALDEVSGSRLLEAWESGTRAARTPPREPAA